MGFVLFDEIEDQVQWIKVRLQKFYIQSFIDFENVYIARR